VLESHARLLAQYAAVVVAGAGSPAEVNLRDRDIALLEPGLSWLEAQTGKPVLGVLPYLHGLYLDAEDAVQPAQSGAGAFRIVVPSLPRMSNHTDFDALRAHPDVDLRFVRAGEVIPAADLVILPGSKNTRGDLAWLQAGEWAPYLARHLRYGGKVIGICGGYQMLGRKVDDPHGVEGAPGSSAGLGLLDVDTILAVDKRLALLKEHALFKGDEEIELRGYEIHMGVSAGPACALPAFLIGGRGEGARSGDGQVLGTYLHGVFDHPSACAALLRWAGLRSERAVDTAALREASLERIAAATEATFERLVDVLRARPGTQ